MKVESRILLRSHKELQGKDKVLHSSIIQDNRKIRLRSYSVASKMPENHRQDLLLLLLLLLLFLLEFVAVVAVAAVVVVGASVNAILCC